MSIGRLRQLPCVAVLAGGLGTRLSRLSGGRPKCLMPLGGRPFLDWLLDFLVAQGARDVHLCLGFGADQVLAHVRGRRSPRLTSTIEPSPLGTAGALRLALAGLGERFFVVYGDSYTPVVLTALTMAVDRSGRADAVMTVLHNRDWLVPSNVAVDGPFVTEYRKGTGPCSGLEYVDYGVSLFPAAALSALPLGRPADLHEVIIPLVSQRRLLAASVRDRFYEFGTPQSWVEADRVFRTSGAPHPAAASVEWGPVRS